MLHNANLQRLSNDKHSNSLEQFVSYEEKEAEQKVFEQFEVEQTTKEKLWTVWRSVVSRAIQALPCRFSRDQKRFGANKRPTVPTQQARPWSGRRRWTQQARFSGSSQKRGGAQYERRSAGEFEDGQVRQTGLTQKSPSPALKEAGQFGSYNLKRSERSPGSSCTAGTVQGQSGRSGARLASHFTHTWRDTHRERKRVRDTDSGKGGVYWGGTGADSARHCGMSMKLTARLLSWIGGKKSLFTSWHFADCLE